MNDDDYFHMEINKKIQENLKLKKEVDSLKNLIINLRSKLLGKLNNVDKKYLVDVIDENLKE